VSTSLSEVIPTPETLVSELRALARTCGYTQGQLARALGVDRQRVSGWFSPRPHIPRADHALLIQALLDREKRKAKRRAKRAVAKAK
jgi:transcriptional regulator with XRE-family HTH domain